MIPASEAIAVGRGLLGTPYSTYDCINLIKAILRKAEGGERKYTVAGTNSLWRSKDLTMRQENLSNPVPGMLAFKVNGTDVHHVGLVTGPGSVLHSSSAKGCVVETNLLNGQWHYLATHRLIALEGNGMVTDIGTENVIGTAVVTTERTGLRLRNAPETGGVIAQIPRGAKVDILVDGTWPKVTYNGKTGYVSGAYLMREATCGDEKYHKVESDGAAWLETAQAGENGESPYGTTTLISLEDGRSVTLLGRWRIGVD